MMQKKIKMEKGKTLFSNFSFPYSRKQQQQKQKILISPACICYCKRKRIEKDLVDITGDKCGKRFKIHEVYGNRSGTEVFLL